MNREIPENRSDETDSDNSADSKNSKNSSKLTNFFFNEHGRLKSGWRFLIFQLLFVIFGFPYGLGIELSLRNLSIAYDKGGVLSFVVPSFILLSLALFFGWLCGKFLEGLPFRALGAWFTKNWVRDFGSGLTIGAASIAIAVLLAILLGGMRLQINETSDSSAIFSTLGVSLVVFIIAAAAEEAYFRGYILQTFSRARLAWVAIVLTSLFFASAHLNNQNADWLSTANTILAGIWFAIAYLKTRNLWFPFGIHLAWNWLQGRVFRNSCQRRYNFDDRAVDAANRQRRSVNNRRRLRYRRRNCLYNCDYYFSRYNLVCAFYQTDAGNAVVDEPGK